MPAQKTDEEVTIEIENIGGISNTSQSLPTGVTVLTGENATNRTSFLQAVRTALGSNEATVKADAKEGSSTLTIEGKKYTRKLKKRNSGIVFSGEPYLDDCTEADLFAFLLEDNEARGAVTMDSSLRDIIMRPVDTSAINRKIKEIKQERDEIDEKLDRLEEMSERLPELEEQLNERKDELEETKQELTNKQDRLSELEAGIEENQSRQEILDQKLDELKQLESRRDRLDKQLESEQESLNALQEDRTDLQDQIAEITPPEDTDTGEITDRLSHLRERKADVESTISRLEEIIRFNEEIVSDDQSLLEDSMSTTESGFDDLTSQLVDDTARCWTCGSEVESSRIQKTLDELQGLRKEHAQQRNDIQDEIQELKQSKREAEQRQQRYQGLHKNLADVEDEIEDRNQKINKLLSSQEQVEEDIEDLRDEIDELEMDVREDVLELHSDVNKLEFERDNLLNSIDNLRDEIASIEKKVSQREQVQAQREEISKELTDLRTRVEQIESDAIEEFNSNMETILSILEYENISRIWIERKETRTGHKSNGSNSRFEMHVIREADSGSVYEDTVDHLSESEREVTGLVFALAGYLVHDVYETVPFMLLDSLEAIDASRISDLIDYLSEHSDYLLVALLKEDAAALDSSYHRITRI